MGHSEHFEIDEISDLNINSDFNAFASRLEVTYRSIVTLYPDPKGTHRAYDKIHLVLVDAQALQSLVSPSAIELSGYFSAAISRAFGHDAVFVNPEGNLDDAFLHRVVHELQHLFLSYYCPGAELWVNEGLSELLAWKVTTLVPLVATSRFLGLQQGRSLFQGDSSRFRVEDYGQSYLFMRYLWENFGGERIFREVALSHQCSLESLVRSFGDTEPVGNILHDFIFSLLLPGPKESGRIGFSKAIFNKKPGSPEKGELGPGVQFALLDVTASMSQGGELEVSASSPLESYLVQYTDQNEMKLVSLKESTDLPRSEHLKSSLVLILNLSPESLSYEVRIR